MKTLTQMKLVGLVVPCLYLGHNRIPGFRMQGIGRWSLDGRPWMQDSGCWALDAGLWILEFGRWTLEAGLWF